MVSSKARNLLNRGVITVPCLTWDGALGEREQRASDALGFLFQVLIICTNVKVINTNTFS